MMIDNFASVYRMLEKNWQRYEQQRTTGEEDLWTRMLEDWKRPYNDMPNEGEFLQALRNLLSEEELRVWYTFPDYSYDEEPVQLDQVRAGLAPELQAQFDRTVQALEDNYMIVRMRSRSGQTGYQRNYFFFLVYYYLLDEPDRISRELWDACLHWWLDLLNGESARLNALIPEYRVLPHQGTLTGEPKFGKIPMNLEIPDQRQVLPMDRLEDVLRGCHSIAVIDCFCRKVKDLAGDRECDHPIKEVCFLFNEAADIEIAAGNARQVDVDEAIRIVADCHERGLMQEISNADHPLSMCNCCKCCCLCVVSQRHYEDSVMTPSGYVAEMAIPDRCIGCGTCLRVCPMDAITTYGEGAGVDVSAGMRTGTGLGAGAREGVDLGADRHTGTGLGAGAREGVDVRTGMRTGVLVDGQKCFGCGICVSKCPKAALVMKRKPGAPKTPAMDRQSRIYI